MPAIRSNKSQAPEKEASKKSRAEDEDEEVVSFFTTKGRSYGKPFKRQSQFHYVPEFSRKPNSEKIVMPVDPRPPRLKLKDLECLRTIGAGSDSKAFLVQTTRQEHPKDKNTVFALKCLSRNLYRKFGAAYIPLEKCLGLDGLEDEEDIDISYMWKQHENNNEKITLTQMPWSPWVTGLIQSFHDSVNMYMALEYIPGTLRSVLERAYGYEGGGLSVAHAQFYYANIALALEFLYTSRIVHKDVKPDNMLVGADGYLVLTDFGNAVLADKRDPAYGSKAVGTTLYMAPELFGEEDTLPKPVNYPFAVDWWASGNVLYEMITGNLPFSKHGEAAEKLILAGEWEWPRGVKVGKNLDDLVMNLLAWNACERLGARSPMAVQAHPWLKAVDWEQMDRRGYLAPFIPGAKELNLEKMWHAMSLPNESHVPGLTLVKPPIHLAHDNRFPIL